MQFKEGCGWKACCDETAGTYTAERCGNGYQDLYEITKEIFDLLEDGMSDEDTYKLIGGGRHLYMDVNDRCGPPYTIVFDEDYEKLCPWSKVKKSGRVWPDELTDAAVEIFESEKNNREQRRKKREEREKRKMVCFLTSRIDDPATGRLNLANRFADELRLRFPAPCRALFICSDPDGGDQTDHYAALTRKTLEDAGFAFDRFGTLDGRNESQVGKLVRESNLLILSGGHVPTQNRFFEKIRLRDLLKDYAGMVIGISAGSMNSADTVYAQPEEEGEAADPRYQRFLTGLNLTKTNLLPHYQENKDDVLDGLRIFEDIACPDSMGKAFYAIPDGSYLLVDEGGEELRGEAYLVKDGVIRQIASHGGVTKICM